MLLSGSAGPRASCLSMAIEPPVQHLLLALLPAGKWRWQCAQEQSGFRRVQEGGKARKHKRADLLYALQARQSRAQVPQGLVVAIEIPVENLVAHIAYLAPDQREESKAHHQQASIDIIQRIRRDTKRTDKAQPYDGGEDKHTGKQDPQEDAHGLSAQHTRRSQ